MTTKPLIDTIDCVSFYVPDIEAGLAFYRERLGHTLVWRSESAAGLSIPNSDAEVVLQNERPGQEIDFKVPSADEAAERFVDPGGSMIVPPFEIQIGRAAVVEDPWGNRFVLLDSSKGALITDAAGRILGNEPKEESYTQLQMIWPEHMLKSPPGLGVPDGYHLRTYQPGDETGFYKVMELAGWPGWHNEKLKPWKARIVPESWYMLIHEESGDIIATAMGLHDHSDHHPFGGELGWVAGDPAHTGKGLGMAICAAVTARLMEAGYRNIHLYTEHWRLAAIKTYLKLGYAPFLYQPEMHDRWGGCL